MALTDFKPHFDNAYQEIFQKVLVSKKISNMRFKPTLTFGESVERVSYDISSVQVRDVTRGSASTIDTISDTSELLTVNIEKEAVFHISDGEVKQAGPLNPGEVIGGQVAIKVALDFDGKVFAEVLNASTTFDTGDLTTLVSSGVPIVESNTTVEQLVSMAPAKLRRPPRNQSLTNLCFVTDSFGSGRMSQYLLGKDIDLAGAVYKNGYTGPVSGAEMYVSENLAATAVISIATQPTAGDTVVVQGVTFTARAVPSVAGEFDIGADVDATRVILANAINGSATGQDSATGYFEVSAADRLLLGGVTATDSPSADTITLQGVGTGALVLSETFTDLTDAVTLNYIHAYFGKKGAIDAVMQDMEEVDMRATDDRRGTNVFSSYLAGIKTFSDGAYKFLDVLLSRI